MMRLGTGTAEGLGKGAALAALLLVSAVACVETDVVEPGSPVLKLFEVYPAPAFDHALGDTLSSTMDPGPVDGAVGIAAVYDRILDGSKLETISADGTTATAIKGAVTATWTGGAIEINHRYMPTGVYKTDPGVRPGPSVDAWGEITVMWELSSAPTMPTAIVAEGFPSGGSVSITLDKGKITGKKGEQFSGTETHTLMTKAFSATKSAAGALTITAPASLTGNAGVTFNTVPNPSTKAAVTVTAGGTTVAGTTVVLNAANHNGILIRPPASGWAPATMHTVTISGEAADAWGVKTGAAVMGTFMSAAMAASEAE